MNPSILVELALLFLRLGATAFGGPAAHIAMMQRELVTARSWLSPQEFLDLVGAANLIPGPTSTEVALHMGYKRGGLAGLCVAGICFILPAALMVLALAVLYQRWGALPEARWLLNGVQPIVVAIVAHALWKLLGTAIQSAFTALIAMAVLIAALAGVSEISLILIAGLIGLALPPQKIAGVTDATNAPSTPEQRADSSSHSRHSNFIFVANSGVLLTAPLLQIFWVFLKIGALVYGSGYVLLAFLQTELVENLKWISSRQLLDAVAIGQITPGPLFTSATFIGYLISGAPGALAATAGIFLPAFIFSALVSANWERLNAAPRARYFLDAVNAASVTLMVLVTFELGRVAVNDAGLLFALVAFIAALLILTFTRLNSMWLMLAGAFAGYLIRAL